MDAVGAVVILMSAFGGFLLGLSAQGLYFEWCAHRAGLKMALQDLTPKVQDPSSRTRGSRMYTILPPPPGSKKPQHWLN